MMDSPNEGAKAPTMEQEVALWHDLFAAELVAKNAVNAVTDRAVLYLDLNLIPVERVLDALKCTAGEFRERVAAREMSKAENRAAADRMDQRRRDDIAAAVAAAQPAGPVEVEPEMAVL
jgi:hypothetical protein